MWQRPKTDTVSGCLVIDKPLL